MPYDMPRTHPSAISKELVCGSCQWFSAGFRGQTCRHTRGVESTTVACVEYTAPLEDAYYEISRDKFILGIRQALKGPRFDLDGRRLSDELKGYILECDISKYDFGSTQNIMEVLEVLRKIIAHRSRVSTIYTSMLDVRHDLNEINKNASLWLYSKYREVRDLKNEKARQAAFNRILPEVVTIEEDVDLVLSTAKHVEERLDRNERTLIAIKDSCEKLWFSKEGRAMFRG